jgi:undecaprenyl-diphosphatase
MSWQVFRTFDLPLFHALNGHAGNSLIDHVIKSITSNRLLGGGAFVAPYWYYWFRKEDQAAERLAIRRKIGLGLFGGLGAIVICRTLAMLLPFRQRPMYDTASGFIGSLGGADMYLEKWSAFPSDTAAFTIALALGVHRFAPRLTAPLAAYAVLAGAIVRVYFGIHYPSDVLAGLLIGAVAAFAVDNPLSINVIDSGLGWEKRSPGLFYLVAILATAEMTVMFDNVRAIARGAVYLFRNDPKLAALLLTLVGLGMATALLTIVRRHRQAAARMHPASLKGSNTDPRSDRIGAPRP